VIAENEFFLGKRFVRHGSFTIRACSRPMRGAITASLSQVPAVAV
jgi:hypothetical protein